MGEMNEVAVFKYPVPIGVGTDEFTLNLPDGARPLSFQAQRGEAMLWALVDPDAKPTRRRFRVAGTGHPIATPVERLRFIGTSQFGSLVFHLFEIVEPGPEGGSR